VFVVLNSAWASYSQRPANVKSNTTDNIEVHFDMMPDSDPDFQENGQRNSDPCPYIKTCLWADWQGKLQGKDYGIVRL
jgi:hypothetical protein